jgi:uncharacterized protein GlcG (DUF336 family)
MHSITLQAARRIVEAAFEKGSQLGLKPLAVAILDSGGHLKAFERQDGTSILRPQIAHGKAYGALCLGQGSRAIFQRAQEQPFFIGAVNAAAGGALVPVPGGVLIRNGEGEIIGAVGITGDTSDNDEACAVAGIEAAGLTADAG